MAIVSGFIYGLGISFMLGTVFFTLVKYGLINGVKAGVAIATGVIATDICFILMAYFFTDVASAAITANKVTITVLGAVFILGLGIFGLLQKQTQAKNVEGENGFSWPKLIGLGATLNATNPVNFFVWLALNALMLGQGKSNAYVFWFFAASLAAIFLAEVFIAKMAQFFSHKLKGKTLNYIKKGINMVFIVIGIFLMLSVL